METIFRFAVLVRAGQKRPPPTLDEAGSRITQRAAPGFRQAPSGEGVGRAVARKSKKLVCASNSAGQVSAMCPLESETQWLAGFLKFETGLEEAAMNKMVEEG
jgi:hypothetical protein